MRTPLTHISLFFGVFVVMALSNAIVPVLPAYATGSTMQGAIYSAYFLGALLSTLPGGILSDRFGKITVMRAGLLVTVASGFFLILIADPVPSLLARFVEGIGAGLFVAAGMAMVNSSPDHEKMSGYYLALLNTGLVLGLVCSGWLSVHFSYRGAGLLAFACLAAIPAAVSLFPGERRDPGAGPSGSLPAGSDPALILDLLVQYRWLWLSTVVLIGITGVVVSLYPEFSGLPADTVSLWIAAMSIATVVTVLFVTRFAFSAVAAIRWSAAAMAAGTIISFYVPAGFIILGIVAGIVMIAQMAFLSGVRSHQGVLMGLFSMASYLGMALLPAMAGIVADRAGFFAAFSAAAASAVLIVVTIGFCPGPAEGTVGSTSGKQ